MLILSKSNRLEVNLSGADVLLEMESPLAPGEFVSICFPAAEWERVCSAIRSAAQAHLAAVEARSGV